jgi:hypothetical protein
MVLITSKPIVATYPPPPPCHPPAPIKGGDPRQFSPHPPTLHFPFLRAQTPPPLSPPSLAASSSSPGRYTTARAPVRPEMGSPHSPLFCALAGELPCSRVLPSTPLPVHGGPRDPAVVHLPWTWSTRFPLLK